MVLGLVPPLVPVRKLSNAAVLKIAFVSPLSSFKNFHMLPSEHRLPLGSDFFTGQRLRNPLFDLIFKPNSLPHSRLAFIVSKTISPKAVVRQLLKRRLRHAVLPLLKTHPGYDLLLIAKPPLKDASFDKVQELMEQQFHTLIKMTP